MCCNSWGHKELTVNFLMFKLVLEKAEEPEIKLPTSTVSSKKHAEHQVSGKHGTRSLSLWNPRSKESLVKQKQKPVAVIPSTMAGLLILLPRGLSLSEGGLYEQRKMLIKGLTEQFHVSST